MLPLHIALVPSDDAQIDPTELLHVAATLQIQLSRDFEPVWKIPATVAAFTALKHVPPACLPIIILPRNTLGSTGDHGFHTTEKGTPIALVDANPGWSRAASHELLEMVCDPQGKRKVIGESLADLRPQDVASGNDQFVPQGQVAYLLEICDPCQDQPYILNGIEVSDFVLPRYYAGGTTECGCYSFAGNVKGPLDLCDGGYVTWYTSFDESPVWQAKKDAASHAWSIGPMTIPAPSSSRSDVDFTKSVFDSLESTPPGAPHAPRAPSAPPPTAAPALSADDLAKRSAERYGEELAADLRRVLADVSTAPPQVDLDKVIAILDHLVNTTDYYERFFSDAKFRSDELRPLGRDVTYPHGEPSKDQLKAVLDKVQRATNKPTTVSAKYAATMVQGQT
jgi:hypothetical protein